MSFTRPILFEKRDWSRVNGFDNYHSNSVSNSISTLELSEIGKTKQYPRRLLSKSQYQTNSQDNNIVEKNEYAELINKILQTYGLTRLMIRSIILNKVKIV